VDCEEAKQIENKKAHSALELLTHSPLKHYCTANHTATKHCGEKVWCSCERSLWWLFNVCQNRYHV